MVKLELNLPWKPVLAWPWGVKYVINPETYLVTSHEESWDIEPWQVRHSGMNLQHYFSLLILYLPPKYEKSDFTFCPT